MGDNLRAPSISLATSVSRNTTAAETLSATMAASTRLSCSMVVRVLQ